MLRRIVLVGAAFLAAGSIAMAPAGAQDGGGGNYGGCNATVSDTTPTAGQKVTVSGSGAAVSGDVSASLDDAEIGSGTADADGNFMFDATIPSTANGTESVTVDCGPNRAAVVLSITVGGSGGLPATGSDSIPLAGVAIFALALGAGFVGLARYRSQTAS